MSAPIRTATVGLRSGLVERLATRVASVKRVPAGHGVSYGHEHVTGAETTLALVPLGYGDGIPRRQRGAELTIDGTRWPIAGRVAMDQVVVDVGGAPVAEGAEVVAWGSDGASLDEWGAWARLPASAVATPIGRRTRIELVDVVPDSDAMEALGAHLASELRQGDAVILVGELGAGKTTLTRGLGAALGASGTVSSPTFVVARTHETSTAPLLHVDAYRVSDPGELWDLDLDFEGSITVAEWGVPLTEQLDSWLEVTIERPLGGSADDLEAPTPRRVTLRGVGASWPSERVLALTGERA